ncbi:MAG: hypothetical protein M3Q56_12125 [Bacteroidota bacterium]|nr:hypothetical protein [Bacteroidota bacterium]
MKNTSKLYYPYIESLRSILPIVDELIIAMGDHDADDLTEKAVLALQSPKIKIIKTVWDIEKYPHGTEYAHQTELAKQHCTGDWLFYLQSDEVIHEKYLDKILQACKLYLNEEKVEGFLFNYIHFWGDYKHYIQNHAWYSHEIRIIRNKPEIHSWGDAQSFKYIRNFDGRSFRQKQFTRRLHVIKLEAYIYHYGWVRPPSLMQQKTKQMDSHYHEAKEVSRRHDFRSEHFDYGNLSNCNIFNDSHPAVMEDFINQFNWSAELHYDLNYIPQRLALKHEKLKYVFLSWLENNLLGGQKIFGYQNWKLVRSYKS